MSELGYSAVFGYGLVGFGLILGYVLGLFGIGCIGFGSSVWVWMGCEVYCVDYAMDLDKTAPNPTVHPRSEEHQSPLPSLCEVTHRTRVKRRALDSPPKQS